MLNYIMNDHKTHYQQDDECETALDLSVKTSLSTIKRTNIIVDNYDQPPNKRKKTQPKPYKNIDMDDEYYSDDETTSTTTTIITSEPISQHKNEPVVIEEDQIQQPEQQQSQPTVTTGKKQMRFQCKFCTYRSHSVSLMQNHIYRHIDTTPYSCFYCGHKSTTKSTIMVHIELCHPNTDVKIKENRVKEEDYYLDLNSSSPSNSKTTTTSSRNTPTPTLIEQQYSRLVDCENKFQIIPSKCQHGDEKLFNELNSTEDFLNINSSPTTASSSSSCVSPAISPNTRPQNEIEVTTTVHTDES
jgi:hypothetical protein